MSAPTLLIALRRLDRPPPQRCAQRGCLFPGATAIVADVQREPATLGQAAALARIADPGRRDRGRPRRRWTAPPPTEAEADRRAGRS